MEHNICHKNVKISSKKKALRRKRSSVSKSTVMLMTGTFHPNCGNTY